MKILFYINAIHHGGAERVMVNLATALSECGHDCILVTSITESWEYKVGANVKRISLYAQNMPHSFIVRNINTTLKLRKVVREEKPDIVISFMAEPNFRAIIATLGTKSKSLVSVRNDPKKEYPTLLFEVAAKMLYPFADGVVFQTVEAKEWFPKRIQKKSRIIFNQVDAIFFDTKFKKNRKGIVTTGRLVPQKNHELLIRAFAKISNNIEENLIIYGDGELDKTLKNLAENLGVGQRVFFPGATKNVQEVLSSAKVFVLSSNFEGMPNSLLEAMAIGLPCISTDCPCGGPRNVIEDGKNGILVPVDDVEAMANAIEYILNSADKLEEMGTMAKRKAEIFKPNVVLAEWKDYIKVIVD